MRHPIIWRSIALLATTCAATGIAITSRADTLDVVQSLRAGVCSAGAADRQALHHDGRLDAAARYWALGQSPATAIARSGYSADASAMLHVTGSTAALKEALRESACATLRRPELRDVGSYRRDAQTWIMLAAPYTALSPAQQPEVGARALELVNAARRQRRHCGTRDFDSAPPLRHAAQLDTIALAHAREMADYDYLEHQDRSGRSPAQRVRSAGYHENLVGENIAYGPDSAPEVVQGWLASAGHCENLMNPGFKEMGIAFASGRGSHRRGLYWVQLLARPAPPER